MKKRTPMFLSLLAAPTLCFANDTISEQEKVSSPHQFSGRITLVNKYYSNGITTTYGNSGTPLGNAGADAPESDHPTLQWGLDYVHDCGFYAGYWGSQVNFSYKQLGGLYNAAQINNTLMPDMQKDKSIENDPYIGFARNQGNFRYDIGLMGYFYINGKYADSYKSIVGVGYKGVMFKIATMLKDVVWANQGDTTYELSYSHALPYHITMASTLTWASYRTSGRFLNATTNTATGQTCAVGESFLISGCAQGSDPVKQGFSYITLNVSQPISKTGLSWGLQGIIGGVNRFGIHQDNKLVGSLSYSF